MAAISPSPTNSRMRTLEIGPNNQHPSSPSESHLVSAIAEYPALDTDLEITSDELAPVVSGGAVPQDQVRVPIQRRSAFLQVSKRVQFLGLHPGWQRSCKG